MQPQQPQPTPQDPLTAPPQPPIPAAPIATPVNNHKRVVLALWLMIGPTALIIVTIILYTLSNFIIGSGSGSGMFNQPSPLQSVINILLFLVGTIVVITWLPGLIAGIILLATRKK